MSITKKLSTAGIIPDFAIDADEDGQDFGDKRVRKSAGALKSAASIFVTAFSPKDWSYSLRAIANFGVMAWLLIQAAFCSGDSGMNVAICQLKYGVAATSILAPALRLDATAVSAAYQHMRAGKALPKMLRFSDASATDFLSGVQPRQVLLTEIRKEQAIPGTGRLPEIIVMSDFHGEINLFLSYCADVLSKKTGKKITLDHLVFPDVSIKEQLARQGVDIRRLRTVKFHLLGDYSDRGRYGIKCSLAAEELKTLGVAEVVTGNHDVLELMAAMNAHLPVYRGYDFYGHAESEHLVFVEHWNDEDIVPDRAGWWSEKLARYMQEQQELQRVPLPLLRKYAAKHFRRREHWEPIDEDTDFRSIRKQLKEIYLDIQDQLDPEEQELWQDLIGFFFGTTDVSTGFNAVGMMSAEWWQERLEQSEFFCEQARKRARSPRAGQQSESPHQILIWEDLRRYTHNAALLSAVRLREAREQGQWWHQVFNDINHQCYESPEWYAMDWIFHDGWGTSVIAELNEMDPGAAAPWDAANFMKNRHIRNFAAFSRKNFTLYLKDVYGNYYTHGWFPVHEQTGEIAFTYKGARYTGTGIWQGLDVLQNDVRDEKKSVAELHEAMSLVMSWYADKTVRIKPAHIKKYIKRFGIESLQRQIGARIWFTCHNPLNTLQPQGIGFVTKQGGYAHISVDKGMSWEKFKDVGGYVTVSAQGVQLHGYSGADFKEIIDNPPTLTLEKITDANGTEWAAKKKWENRPLARHDFLAMMRRSLEEMVSPGEAGQAPMPCRESVLSASDAALAIAQAI